ncbi:hypothetical protein LB518_23130 [Mesorhizobium sp. BR1-1-16]|uniref:hypothetical protein n=1 Tax=Mesorhizobium sp. BR1-1-16 TaxID=2876653 RepID=UPI001CCACDF2|nr:hypothetical protein [Mesorhizobium sp. BR1-1-16]MBZ9939209.1 hypothetical protein [Mesorhizobium sp. BR1-1-16]
MKGPRFDPQRRALSLPLKSAISRLTAYLGERELALGLRQRARREVDHRSFKLAVEVTLCNLVVAEVVGAERVEVYRSLATIRRADPWRPEVYAKGLLDALDVMAHPKVGLMGMATGYRFDGTGGRPTEISSRPALWSHVPPEALSLKAMDRLPEPEVLVLKGMDGEVQPIPSTRTAESYRRRVVGLNARLKALPIDLLPVASGPPYGLGNDGRPVDPTQVTVKRYFNRGRMDRGGRLFGAYWEEMPRMDRFHRLRLGGDPVVNVDYGQLYPRLAYLVADREPPEGDLYAVPGLEHCREGVKLMTSALLFSEHPLKAWPKGGPQAFPKGTKLGEVVGSISSKHPGLVPYFGSGLGYRLMFTESEILLGVLEVLHREGVPALPMHDAVIVPERHGPRAKEVMEVAFERIGGRVSCGLVEVQGMAEVCG